jgi:hypothetical protein
VAPAAGVRSVGYANRPPRVEAFQQAGADVVIDSMGILARILVETADG